MEDHQHIWPVSDVPSDAISIYEGSEVFLSDFARAELKQRVVFAAYWLQAETLNGGLHQFFSNDTGVLAPEAAEACRALGLPKLAAIVEHAMHWFGPQYLREREARQSALEAYGLKHPAEGDPFADMDDKIANLIYEENGGLEQSAIAYVRNQSS